MRYIFGHYVLDTLRYELHQAGSVIPLRPKVFQVLAYLLAPRTTWIFGMRSRCWMRITMTWSGSKNASWNIWRCAH